MVSCFPPFMLIGDSGPAGRNNIGYILDEESDIVATARRRRAIIATLEEGKMNMKTNTNSTVVNKSRDMNKTAVATVATVTVPKSPYKQSTAAISSPVTATPPPTTPTTTIPTTITPTPLTTTTTKTTTTTNKPCGGIYLPATS